MSQYKAAMARMLGGSDTDVSRTFARPSEQLKQPTSTGNPIADYLIDRFDPLINFVIPVIWCALFVLIMDREGVMNYWYMPFLGLFAAVLCNTVPIGGGVVYVPALSMLGVDMHLGVSFSVAVMTIACVFSSSNFVNGSVAFSCFEVLPTSWGAMNEDGEEEEVFGADASLDMSIYFRLDLPCMADEMWLSAVTSIRSDAAAFASAAAAFLT